MISWDNMPCDQPEKIITPPPGKLRCQMSPEKRPFPNERIVFQASFLKGSLSFQGSNNIRINEDLGTVEIFPSDFYISMIYSTKIIYRASGDMIGSTKELLAHFESVQPVSFPMFLHAVPFPMYLHPAVVFFSRCHPSSIIPFQKNLVMHCLSSNSSLLEVKPVFFEGYMNGNDSGLFFLPFPTFCCIKGSTQHWYLIQYNQKVWLWYIQPRRNLLITLPETNIAHENRPLEKEIPIGNHHFYGRKC